MNQKNKIKIHSFFTDWFCSRKRNQRNAVEKKRKYPKPIKQIIGERNLSSPFILKNLHYQQIIVMLTRSVADFACLSRIPDQGSKRTRIPDPHQRIHVFLTQKLFLCSRKYDPGCTSRIRIQESKRHQIPDPQHCFIVYLVIAKWKGVFQVSVRYLLAENQISSQHLPTYLHSSMFFIASGFFFFSCSSRFWSMAANWKHGESMYYLYRTCRYDSRMKLFRTFFYRAC